MINEIIEEKVTKEIDIDKREQKSMCKRIKRIREEELKMKKTELGREIGISGQFLGLVEEGKGNLAYKSIKRLMEISGHSADYILYGLDDSVIDNTKKLLQKYKEEQIIKAMNVLKEIAIFINDE